MIKQQVAMMKLLRRNMRAFSNQILSEDGLDIYRLVPEI